MMTMHAPPLAAPPPPPAHASAASSMDLVLKSSCEGCGSTKGLYGSNCKHVTLCFSCGKAMAAARSKCYACGSVISRLIRVGVPLLIFSLCRGSDCLPSVEYKVGVRSTQKLYSMGRFATGLPSFSKKKCTENKWSLHQEGFQGFQLTESLRDETGQHQYRGQIEGAQSTAYYILMMHGNGKEFVAVPTGSWYNFNKIAQYKQLTLEEAKSERVEDEVGNSAVFAPKQKDVPKEIQSDNISSKAAPSGSSRGISSASKSGKSKRKHGSDNAKTTNGASVKKAKTDNVSKPWSVLDEPASNARNRVPSNSSAPSFSNSGSTSTVCFDIEDEIRTVMVQIAPVTTKDLVTKFKSRLQSKEDVIFFARQSRVKFVKVQAHQLRFKDGLPTFFFLDFPGWGEINTEDVFVGEILHGFAKFFEEEMRREQVVSPQIRRPRVYNFNKIAQYKQLTLEEAEDKMRNRRKTADGYERWMMKAEANGGVAFGAVEKTEIERGEVADGNRRRKRKGDSGEDAAEKGEEDGGEEEMNLSSSIVKRGKAKNDIKKTTHEVRISSLKRHEDAWGNNVPILMLIKGGNGSRE
ncbi:Transcription initiation factor IIF subunit alpha [Acorus calamus]|uniref:Transcription initiation factor IIF subunit alpha n=1 Tax=Acorus calamus TaxID=4465 RepID=A0AAV9E1M2_ACOCL|nr:Transcription initiation factor IIF subunit alpha [Acorus calamus]